MWLQIICNSYEKTYIWWYEIIKINLFSQALFEKTHISVILYYKIDHFCPLKSNFHSFSAIWPNVWIWNSLLPSFYHLLAQVRHAQSHFFPLGTNDWAKSKPRCKKYATFLPTLFNFNWLTFLLLDFVVGNQCYNKNA